MYIEPIEEERFFEHADEEHTTNNLILHEDQSRLSIAEPTPTKLLKDLQQEEQIKIPMKGLASLVTKPLTLAAPPQAMSWKQLANYKEVPKPEPSRLIVPPSINTL